MINQRKTNPSGHSSQSVNSSSGSSSCCEEIHQTNIVIDHHQPLMNHTVKSMNENPDKSPIHKQPQQQQQQQIFLEQNDKTNNGDDDSTVCVCFSIENAIDLL